MNSSFDSLNLCSSTLRRSAVCAPNLGPGPPTCAHASKILHQPRHHHTVSNRRHCSVDGNQRRCDDIETCIACSRLGSSSLPPGGPVRALGPTAATRRKKIGGGGGGGGAASCSLHRMEMDGRHCVGVGPKALRALITNFQDFLGLQFSAVVAGDNNGIFEGFSGEFLG
jgi:hypothetical protein